MTISSETSRRTSSVQPPQHPSEQSLRRQCKHEQVLRQHGKQPPLDLSGSVVEVSYPLFLSRAAASLTSPLSIAGALSTFPSPIAATSFIKLLSSVVAASLVAAAVGCSAGYYRNISRLFRAAIPTNACCVLDFGYLSGMLKLQNVAWPLLVMGNVYSAKGSTS